MKKRIVSSLLACSLVFTAVSAPSLALADDFDQKIEQKDKEINELKSQQASLQSQISSLESQIADINTQAEALLAKQAKLTEETEQLKQEIADLEVRIERREEAIRNQARDVQVNGSHTTLIDAVLNADSLTDAIGRVQAMTTIVNANNDLVKQQKIDKKAVEDKTAENEAKMAEIQKNQVALEAQKGEIESSQAELAVLKADLALQESSKEGEKEALQEQKAAAEAERARIAEEERLAAEAQAAAQAAAVQAQTTASSQTQSTTASSSNTASSSSSANSSTTNSSTGNTTSNSTSSSTQVAPGTTTPVVTTPSTSTPAPAPSGNGAAVVAEAYKHIGKPYVWGAKGPDTFDCSGFTSYVFRQATGREIGGWTVPQESAGTKISVGEAQAGDLYFWGSPGGTYHVAIALGGGQYIHAPQPGESVKVGSVSYYAPSFAVRM